MQANIVTKDVSADVPSIQEVKAAISKLNYGKLPGIDGLQKEIFKYDCPNLMKHLANLMPMVWNKNCVPQDWRDAFMVVLYNRKVRKDDHENHSSISLLPVVWKVLFVR